MRRTLAFLPLLALVGCQAQPIGPAQTSNPGVTADLIARIESCNLYRLYDGANRVYMASCSRGETRIRWEEGCGKGCTRPIEALTLDRSSGDR